MHNRAGQPICGYYREGPYQGLRYKVYQKGVSAESWEELVPEDWIAASASGKANVVPGSPSRGVASRSALWAYFQVVAVSRSTPLMLSQQRSKDSPQRLVNKGTSIDLEMSFHPFDWRHGCRPLLRLDPRHQPTVVTVANGDPVGPTDGYDIHDIEEVTAYYGQGGFSAAIDYTIWLFNGNLWVPHPDHTAVSIPADGIRVQLDELYDATRIYTEFSGAGIGAGVNEEYSFSGSPNQVTQVTIEAWYPPRKELG